MICSTNRRCFVCLVSALHGSRNIW